MTIYQHWMDMKQIESEARQKRLELERQIVENLSIPETLEGTETKEYDGYKIKITGRITRRVDAEKARQIAVDQGLDDQLNRLFRWKAEINAKNWKASDPAVTGPFSDAIESKPGKPAISITKVEE